MPEWKHVTSLSQVPPVVGAAVYGDGFGSGAWWLDMTEAPGQVEATLTSGAIPETVWETTLPAIADGGFAITINGTARQVGPIGFAGITTGDEAAALIHGHLPAGSQCAFRDPVLVITAPAAAGGAITYASAPASGTDISTLLHLTAATGAVIGGG